MPKNPHTASYDLLPEELIKLRDEIREEKTRKRERDENISWSQSSSDHSEKTLLVYPHLWFEK
jgi:hypothetical protein